MRLDFPYPDAKRDLNRWLPLVKWLLAIPHYIVLLFLYLALIVLVIGAWFAILFTGRYPRGIFDFVEGVIRWHNRVVGYALILVTDRYPPFSLGQREAAAGDPCGLSAPRALVQRVEVRVDQGRGHGALAHRGGDALDRTVAHVAGDEQPGLT